MTALTGGRQVLMLDEDFREMPFLDPKVIQLAKASFSVCTLLLAYKQ
jgi:hypothetical protein